jgi:hypothetical protein
MKNKPSFYTHSVKHYPVGKVTEYGVIVKVEQVENTHLANGGSVPCFSVYCESAQQSVHPTKSRWALFLDKLSAAFRG